MQVDGFSLQAQTECLRKYAEYKNLEIVGEYSDKGKSGCTIKGRPDFVRMIDDIVSEKDEEFNGKSNRTVLSLGHSAATYEEAKHTFELGAGHVTHLFNAKDSVHHRHPAIIPAAAENGKVTT